MKLWMIVLEKEFKISDLSKKHNQIQSHSVYVHDILMKVCAHSKSYFDFIYN